MKIKLDLNNFPGEWYYLKDQAAYDDLSESPAGYERWKAIPWGTPKGASEVFSHNPEKFPCILLYGDFRCRSDMADEQHVVYLYDFEIIEIIEEQS